MAGVAHGAEGDAALPGLVEAMPHGELGDGIADAVVAVDRQRHGRLLDDLRLRVGFDEAVGDVAAVQFQAADAVRGHAARLGFGQHAGGEGRVGGGIAEAAQHGSGLFKQFFIAVRSGHGQRSFRRRVGGAMCTRTG